MAKNRKNKAGKAQNNGKGAGQQRTRTKQIAQNQGMIELMADIGNIGASQGWQGKTVDIGVTSFPKWQRVVDDWSYGRILRVETTIVNGLSGLRGGNFLCVAENFKRNLSTEVDYLNAGAQDFPINRGRFGVASIKMQPALVSINEYAHFRLHIGVKTADTSSVPRSMGIVVLKVFYEGTGRK